MIAIYEANLKCHRYGMFPIDVIVFMVYTIKSLERSRIVFSFPIHRHINLTNMFVILMFVMAMYSLNVVGNARYMSYHQIKPQNHETRFKTRIISFLNSS